MSKENTKKEKVEVPEMECNQKTEEPKIMNVTMATVDENETEYKDLYLRTLADMDNLRKNTTKKINDIYKMANDKLIKELLPFVDSLNLAVSNENIKLDEKTYSAGYEVLKKQFENILGRFGVKEIEILALEQFDDSKMNAIMTMTTKNKNLHNKVCDVTKKGYMLYDKVLRYADVVVYNYSE